MRNVTGKWDAAIYGPISPEAIRLQFRPEGRYRVSWNRYPAGATFDGWSRAGRHYIISGSCSISIKGDSWDLSSGDFIDFQEGDFLFSVPGDAPVELVSVWELPESFCKVPRGSLPAV